MKALPCPGCGAPLAVKQGIAAVKCSFCDLDVKIPHNLWQDLSELGIQNPLGGN